MKQLDKDTALSYFKPDHGELQMIYGAIGNGKTTLATSMALEYLNRGQVVYTSWRINWDGYDQRDSAFIAFIKFVFFRKSFLKFDKSNWRHLDCYAPDIWDKLETLTNCHIFFDDVIVRLFDSYEQTKFSKSKREWAFFTRHFDRSIYLVTQRTSQIQVSLRSQINRFYRCTKVLKWPVIVFKREEFQDMDNEDVKDDVEPDSVKYVLGSKRVFSMFTSKYLRKGMLDSQQLHVLAYKLNYRDRFKAFIRQISNLFSQINLRKKVRNLPDVKNDVPALSDVLPF